VEAQLAAKELQKVDSGSNPDLVATYHAAVGEETQFNTMNMGGWGGGGMSSTSVDKIPTGQLIVDLGDVKNKKLIWRGTASGILSDKPEKNEKNLNKALTKTFKKYPPPVKK
jgi:Domain of unknown function (DUF4136)